MTPEPISFWLDDKKTLVSDLPGTTTLLRYLRDHAHQLGTKEGCAEGDCGACSVVLVDHPPGGEATFRVVDACLLFLPMLQGRRVYTVEGLRAPGEAFRDRDEGYHPVQQALVDTRGSQCGYCTPGVVMSLVEAAYRRDLDPADHRALDEQLAGNLCRCTGYRSIREAAAMVAGTRPQSHIQRALKEPERDHAISYTTCAQTYLQPASLPALWEARAAHPDAVLVAGGTDVALEVTRRHRHIPTIIGLEAIPELKGLTRNKDMWLVGAGVTLTTLEEAVKGRLPALEKMLRFFGARQIRNRGTVGGNICNASPVGDLAPVFLALDATAIAAGPDGERAIPMAEFFTGYRQTALEPDEILLRVDFNTPPSRTFVTSYKVSKRRELDISSVSAGMAVRLDRRGNVAHVRVAFGGMAATPLRAHHTERSLLGRPWSSQKVREALDRLDDDFTPISDHRGSAHWRRLLARNLLLGFALESGRPDRDSLPARPVGTVTPPPRTLS